MSAIRPPITPPLVPIATPLSPARASRSDFFRAALDAARAPEPAPRPAVEVAVRSVRSQTASDTPEVFARPGSLLDIRI